LTWKAVFLGLLIMFSAAVTLCAVLSLNAADFAAARGASDSEERQILRDPIDGDGPGALRDLMPRSTEIGVL